MKDLEDYKPWFNDFCGHDLMALEKAHKRCREALRKPGLPAREIERLQELLQAGSIVHYETTRAAWAEMTALLPIKETIYAN